MHPAPLAYSPAPGNNNACSKNTMVFLLVMVVVAMLFSVQGVQAREIDESRIWAGLELFPSFLAADQDIRDKKGEDGHLLLLLVYTDKRQKAETMATRLLEVQKIRSVPVRVEVVTADELTQNASQRVAGIFLTQPLLEHLPAVIDFGTSRQVIVFSPFVGDVQRGILGGIVIKATILPQVNESTMRQSDLRLKSFFLRISEMVK